MSNLYKHSQLIHLQTEQQTQKSGVQVAEITGLTHRHVVELLLRKYGKELESWVGVPLLSSVSIEEIREPTPALLPAPTQYYPEPTINLPKDRGKGLKPIQL